METVRTGVKDLIPGSPLFLVFALAGVALLLFGPVHAARWGRTLLLGLLILYATLSLQGTSDWLVSGLQGSYRAIRTRDDARGATAIVVLSNGAVRVDLDVGGLGVLNVQSTYNTLEAARVYALLGTPLVLASGGPPLGPRRGSESVVVADALVTLGIPRSQIDLEPDSWNTRTQAINSVRWLKTHGVTRFVLVTTPEHMRRAMGVFHSLGVDPIPSVSAIQYGGPPFWKPTRYALQGSTNAIYEYLAWGFYAVRGWN